jgi:hypothetical protein
MEETKDTRIRIIEAFSSDGCPLCAMLRRDEFDSLCQWVGLSEEIAKDSAQRKQFLTAGGFCNYHFWQFERMNTHYGSAGIAVQLIEKLLQILRTHKQKYFADAIKYKGCHSKIQLNDNNAECPLCCELCEKERVYLKELLAILRQNEYRSRYEKICGLCMPHLMKVINYIDDISFLKFLFKTEIDQLEKVKTDAAGFVGKRYPPLRWEQTDNEKNSWFRAIEKIVGRSGS